jgi:hypothetical protein
MIWLGVIIMIYVAMVDTAVNNVTAMHGLIDKAMRWRLTITYNV